MCVYERKESFTASTTPYCTTMVKCRKENILKRYNPPQSLPTGPVDLKTLAG